MHCQRATELSADAGDHVAGEAVEKLADCRELVVSTGACLLNAPKYTRAFSQALRNDQSLSGRILLAYSPIKTGKQPLPKHTPSN